ncbi:hypothetical protein GGI04_002038 [Coemansia thaxteri]|nr:hypothetical protein GGI04_002038 [Coemansia thaxteri]
MDRRVSLPSFQEISDGLPRPAVLPGKATSPQPIPQKPPARSPRFHGRHPDEHRHGGYYPPNSGYAIYSNRPSPHSQHHYGQQHQMPPVPPLPQTYASSYPCQGADYMPPSSPPPLHQQPQPHLVRPFEPSEHAHAPRGSAMTLRNSAPTQTSRIPPGNVHLVAQVTPAGHAADPIRPPYSNASSLPHAASSFMHSSPPSSTPRYAPYHMPGAATSPTHQGPLSNEAGGRVLSPLSPAHKHNAGGGVGSPPSRAAAISNANVASSPQQHQRQQHFYQQQQQHRSVPVMSSPPAPLGRHFNSQHQVNGGVAMAAAAGAAGTAATAVSPTASSHHQREPSVPELIEEDNMDYDDNTPQNGLADDDSMDGGMSTAKIRTIHKLAERRRRREMKNLFDSLRKCLPIDKTIRLSKWEVLKKAIEVISTQDAEIRMLRLHIDTPKSLARNDNANPR